MNNIKNAELGVLNAVRDVLDAYQRFEDNYNDSKYTEIKEHFILPLVGKTDSLITVFGEIEITIRKFSEDGVFLEVEG